MTESGRPPRWLLRALDGLQYGLAVTLVVGLVAALVPYLFTLLGVGARSLSAVNPVLAVQYVLFFGGFLLMAFGALRLRPDAPYKDNSRLSLSLPNESKGGGFGDRVAALPPLGWYDPADHERLSNGGRLLVASGVMLVVSFLLERLLFVVY